MYRAIIFDVDGVLVDSPHEAAWGEALRRLFETEWQPRMAGTTYMPDRYTAETYAQVLSGKPRREGAPSLLAHYRMKDPAGELAERLGEKKQEIMDGWIVNGKFTAFADGIRLVCSVLGMRGLAGAASSSKNANRMLERIDASPYCSNVAGDTTLIELFDANTCGRDFPHGKPDPTIFLETARELGVRPGACVVVEDARAGVQAAKSAGMGCIGIDRMRNGGLEQADWIVEDLDRIRLIPTGPGHFSIEVVHG